MHRSMRVAAQVVGVGPAGDAAAATENRRRQLRDKRLKMNGETPTTPPLPALAIKNVPIPSSTGRQSHASSSEGSCSHAASLLRAAGAATWIICGGSAVFMSLDFPPWSLQTW